MIIAKQLNDAAAWCAGRFTVTNRCRRRRRRRTNSLGITTAPKNKFKRSQVKYVRDAQLDADQLVELLL